MQTPTPNPAVEPAGALAALREQGAQQLDPVRFRYIEALARRAQAHGGAARAVLDARLAEALLRYGQRGTTSSAAQPSTTPTLTRQTPGPLAGLVQHIARQVPERRQAPTSPGAALPLARPTEPPALGYFRNTWAQLRLEQQLSQSLAKQPENAGPLNSHRLVLRSLQVMRDISPAYLRRFMAYVDALQWLDEAGAAGAAAPDNPARAEADKKRKPAREAASRPSRPAS